MNTQHWLLAAFWLLFGLIHSVTATSRFKGLVQWIAGKKYIYYTLAYSLLALVTLLPVVYYQFSIASFYLFRPGLIIMVFSIAGIFIAALICGYSIYKYFVPLSGVAILINEDFKPGLKKDGLNKYVRHPLYFGTLLMIWSFFAWFPLLSNLVACIAITVYTVSGIYFEEQKLAMRFGNDYIIYKREVPMLLPFTRRYSTK